MAQLSLIREETQRTTTEYGLARYAHRTTRDERLNFLHHSYQVPILQDRARRTVIVSCVQSGKTEISLIRIMAHAMHGRSTFYVLPNLSIRERVVRRFDRTLGAVPLYRHLHDIAAENLLKNAAPDSVSIKQIGKATVIFVGSNSEASFGEFPADVVIVDELNRCVQENLKLADQRLAASRYAGRHEVSNPSLAGYGITERYDKSDGKEWFIRCDHCGERQTLTWEDNIARNEGNQWVPRWPGELSWDDMEGGAACRKCERKIHRFAKGEWVAAHPSRRLSGYHLSQLFAGFVTVAELFEEFTESRGDQSKQKAFANGRLGLPYQDAEAQLTREMLAGMVGQHPQVNAFEGVCFGGMDIGGTQHYIIMDTEGKVLKINKIIGNAEAVRVRFRDLMRAFPRCFWVLDAEPETLMVRELIQGFPGRAAICWFHDTPELRMVTMKYDHQRHEVKAARTESFDESHAAMTGGIIHLPLDALSVPDFVNHMIAPVRVYQEPPPSKSVGRFVWDEGNKQDHYRLAMVYCWLARMIRTRYGRQTVTAMTAADLEREDKQAADRTANLTDPPENKT